jgi:hypothetical protein
MSDYVDVDTSREFELPVGLRKNGKVYKKGRMRLLTNKDILEMGDDPDLQRFVDSKIEIKDLNLAKLMKLSEVKIGMAMASLPRSVKFDGLDEFTREDVQAMYNVDAMYLLKLADDMAEEAGEIPKKKSKENSNPPLP